MNAIPSRAADGKGSSEFRVWVVRAGRDGERVAHNLEHRVASIGWDEWSAPDLSSFADRNAYGEYIERDFQRYAASERASSRNQVWRFYTRHQRGRPRGHAIEEPRYRRGLDRN